MTCNCVSSAQPSQALALKTSDRRHAITLIILNSLVCFVAVEEAAGPEQEEASAEDELEHHMEEEQQEELEEPAPEPEEEALDLAEEEPFTSPREDNAREGDDASSCDEGAFHALLGSNPHPKPVRRCVDGVPLAFTSEHCSHRPLPLRDSYEDRQLLYCQGIHDSLK